MRIIVGLIFSLCMLQQLSAQDSKQPVFPDFHNGAVIGIDFSKNNRWLLTGGADGRAMLFDAEKKTLIRQLRGHYDAITGVSFADMDTKVVTTSFDGKLIIWEVKTGLQKRSWNAVSGTMDNEKNWSRNPLFPPFCLDSSKQSMVFFLTQSAIAETNDYRKDTKLCFYDFNKDTIRWTMPVNHFDTEGRPFSLSSNGEWLLFTDYIKNQGTGIDEPFIRLVFTADTALQYKWWGNEAAFDGNEVVICNGHNLLRFNPANESALVRNINGGYGYHKQFAASNYILMQCMQQKEAGNIAARNFNVRSPFQKTADSILYYLTGSREMKLPIWRVADLKNQQIYTISIKGDSSPLWQPVYRINEALLTRGLMAFTKGNEKFAFVDVATGNSVIMSFFPGKSFPKAIASLRNSAGRWLISVEHEPAKKHEAALYELTLDFSQGKGTISKFLSSPILNQSLSVEDDNQILPDLIIFPDGNRVLSSNKKGGIRIADYSNGTVRENAALIPDGKIPLEPAAVNSNGTLIRCFTSFSNIYSFSSKTGQQQTIKKNESWRLLPDQSLFNQSMVCYDADSIWKIEFSRGKALLTNLKNKTFTLIYTGETGMADFQVVNNRFLFGMGTDGGLRAYSLETRQLLFTQYLFENGGNLILTPDGRMDANDEAKKLLYITMGMNVNTIENYTALDGSGFIQIAGLRKQLLR